MVNQIAFKFWVPLAAPQSYRGFPSTPLLPRSRPKTLARMVFHCLRTVFLGSGLLLSLAGFANAQSPAPDQPMPGIMIDWTQRFLSDNDRILGAGDASCVVDVVALSKVDWCRYHHQSVRLQYCGE